MGSEKGGGGETALERGSGERGNKIFERRDDA